MPLPSPDSLQPRFQLLEQTSRSVQYLCLCGRKARIPLADWKGNVTRCTCGDEPRTYPPRNLIGLQFGQLTVISWLGKRDGSMHHHWLVECTCGNRKEISGDNLTRSRAPTQSCGCRRTTWAQSEERRAMIGKDMTGQRFGRLVALRRSDKETTFGRRIYWDMQCDCGQICTVNGAFVRRNRILSCGCMKREPQLRNKDLSGRVFGKLKVLERVDTQAELYLEQWLCQCACGKKATVMRARLRASGPSLTCGACA